MNRTDRLYAIVEELRASAPGRRSARSLADRFDVSVRTIERDVSALQQAGVPIYADTGRSGGYTLDRTRTLPPMNFTPAEAVAVGIALGRATEAPFARSARTALLKIIAAMSAADGAEARELAERIRFLVPGGEDDRAVVPAVVEEAVALRQVVRLAYVDRNGTETERDVEPVAFVSGARDWYLVGWCRLREGPRLFRMDRIRRASLLEETAPVRDFGEMAPRVPDLVAHALQLG
ncbi:helix-turn-helix transcriptional regulator [Actinoallomurus sp. CA-142502]|uniref:helix-turn-helix transcriptional regulator n=1 Tax=Actinoallomurus sp. CA-142502 TaxID=3239885 RepID=UPI003D8EE9E3